MAKLDRFSLGNSSLPDEATDFERKLWEDGIREGKAQAGVEMLSWLEVKFMDPRVDMSSVEGKAILKVVHDLSLALKAKGIVHKTN